MTATETAPPEGAGADRTQRRTPMTLVDHIVQRRVAILVGGVVLVALVVAWRNRPGVLYDDAAITMRYAWRIGHGHGWTYNDFDKTNGASAPLYTLVLAVLGLGMDLPTAARAVCIVCYAVAVGMATYLAERIAGMVAAVLAAIFLLTWLDFLAQSLSGMESAFAVVLGLAVIIALREDRDGWAGVILGLAVINKLDAGLLLVAVVLVYLGIMRRPPWRVLGAAAVTFTPWMLVATAYFGSVIPYSFTQKASAEVVNPAADVSSTWIIELLRNQRMIPMVLLAAAAVVAAYWVTKRHRRAGLALVVCLVWPALHGLAFSVIPLGDRYPWYLTALYAPLAISAACAVATAVDLAPGWWKVGVGIAAVALVAVALGMRDEPGGRFRNLANSVVNGPQASEGEEVESTRREAAKYLASIVEPGDVISTCFGWFAYEAIETPIAETCPLNTRKPVDPPRWATYVAMPSTVEPELPPGARIVATFISKTDPNTQPSMRVDVVELDTGS